MSIIPTDIARLLGLRPKDRSAASIAEALAAAEAEATAAALAAAEIEAERGRRLLSAPPEEVEAAERDLAAQRAVAERAAAMAGALRGELAAAHKAERLAEAERLSREASQAVRDFGDWFATTYPELAARLIEGLRMEDRAHDLAEELTRAKAGIALIDGPAAAAEAERSAPPPPLSAVAAWGPNTPPSHRDIRVAFLVKLPGKAPDSLLWPEDRAAALPIIARST